DTRISVATSGRALAVDEIIRFGVEGETENARIVDVIDPGIIVVERGVNGTRALDHAQGTPLFVAAEVTLGKFLTDTRWAPQIGRFGIIELVVPTIVITLIALLVAVPLGLGAAIYISEYARPRTRALLKPILEILAGIPTVVYGYFALTFVTPLLQSLFGLEVKVYNMASAGIVVGILIIPTIKI